ncbi:MAG: prepilin-type N-terminal cleavage/methylation domain-containing protein [Phycisphaerales bacterium]
MSVRPRILVRFLPPGEPRAFTLVEILLAVAVIAVIVAIAIPALSNTQQRRMELKGIATVRSHAGVLASYAGDFRDMLPYVMDPDKSHSTVHSARSGLTESGRYFEAYLLWHIALADAYYDGNLSPELFVVPWAHPALRAQPAAAHTSYFLPCVFGAHAEYWNTKTRLEGTGQLVPVRSADAATPAKKVVVTAVGLGDLYPGTKGQTIIAAMLDGSVPDLRMGDLSHPLGYTRGDGTGANSIHFDPWPLMLHTVDGIRGRDIR